VSIRGTDFRTVMTGYDDPLTVYFGAQKAAAESIKYVDSTTLKVITPTNTPGVADIRLENPDGETAVYSGFAYIGQPVVNQVVDPDDPEETNVVEEISILGGQVLKIKGTGFNTGARVVFQPVIRPAESTDKNLIYRVKTVETSDGINSVELDPLVLVSGTDGSNIQVLDAETILVTTPAGKIDSGSLMVINSDGGASEPFTDIGYDWPQVDAPLGVVAEVVRDDYYDTDQYIKIYWSPVEGADQYEIYEIENKKPLFIGSTALNSYVYDDLEPRTRYKFLVKAVGAFGSSPPSAESNQVRTGSEVGYPDYDGSLTEYTAIKSAGSNLDVVIGTKDGSDLLILDLTRDTLAGVKQVTLSIPAAVIADSRPGNIRIISADYELNLNPSIFKTAQIVNDRRKEQCGVKFSILPYSGNIPMQAGTVVSGIYRLEASYYRNQSSNSIDYTDSNVNMIMKYDKAKADMRRLNLIEFCRCDDDLGTWQPLNMQGSNGDARLGMINRMGVYALIGSRR